MKKILENIIHKMFYSCEKATLMIEQKASPQGISKIENLRLKAHLSMCKFCRAYNKKVAIIDKYMNSSSKKKNIKIDDVEIKDFKEQLKDKILR